MSPTQSKFDKLKENLNLISIALMVIVQCLLSLLTIENGEIAFKAPTTVIAWLFWIGQLLITVIIGVVILSFFRREGIRRGHKSIKPTYDEYLMAINAHAKERRPRSLKEYMTKDEILEKINPGENSKFAIDHAPREGWVVTYANNDKLFARWKYKNPAFKERERQPKAEKLVDDELLNARLDFMGYLTLNRAIGLLSKTTDRTMKTLLPQFVDDAKEDFFIDHPELKEREEKWQKAIFNAGKTPYLVMLEALEKEKQA